VRKKLPALDIQKEVLELTKDLIRIPSTHSRQSDIHKCADFIVDWLSRNDITFQRYTIKNVPSITVLPANRTAPLLLMSHFDVVEVEDTSLFSPKELNGSLYGRGAIDDKYAVALSLVLFKNHLNGLKQDGGTQQDMSFGLLLTGDEEVGGFNGVGTISKDIDTDFFITIDGGNPELIVNKEKGILQLRLTATGKAAHAARPWLGRNAFDVLVDDYRKIQAIFNDQTPDHWHKTMVLSNCKAGNGSINVIPDRVTATLDIRYTERDDPDEILATIENAIQSDVTVTAKEPVFSSAPSPYIDLLVHHSDNARVGFEHGASDARFLSQRGIPGVICGAEGEMSLHTEEEHIVLSSLYDLYDRLDHFLQDVTLKTVTGMSPLNTCTLTS
jgi:succinyl-diaminopimelate desuccinylase